MYYEKTRREENSKLQNVELLHPVTLEQFPENPTAKKLMSSITGNRFYENSYIGKWLFQVMGLEWEDAEQRLKELEAQVFYHSADWGLAYHEQKYGLPSRGTLKERKQRIRKKIMQTLPFNPALLCKNLSALSGLAPEEILISENTAPYTFTIEFCENDTSGDGAKAAREYTMRVKPSHLHLEAFRKYRGAAWQEIGVLPMLTARSSFYPRYNLELLVLDGSWDLEGDYFLNGYKIGRNIEFYPVKLWLKSSFCVPDAENLQILFRGSTSAKPNIHVYHTYFDSILWKLYSHSNGIVLTRFPKPIRLEAIGTAGLTALWHLGCRLQPVIRSPADITTKAEVFLLLSSASRQQIKLKAENHYKSHQTQKVVWNTASGSTAAVRGQPKAARQLIFRSKMLQETSCKFRLDVEKDLWYLNGETLLDGSRRLDADIFHYEL